ncbi:hypothetical protein ACFFVB_13215 [Formosa undariae]|uniref:Uncharacterized protein n=1 Tax=Formosa undariae TaxID=1325436 RepID=A0ABV5F3N0_9FLAO
MNILATGSRIDHSEFGKGVVTNVTSTEYWVTFIENGLETIAHDAGFDIIEATDSQDLDTVSFYDIERSLKHILKTYSDVSEIVPIADKWKGGTLVLTPGDANLQEKVIPIESFFSKIIMVRDRIRVMEQKVNSSKLDPQEKVDLQQYITLIYGSLTTFNVLFKSKDQQFVVQKSK